MKSENERTSGQNKPNKRDVKQQQEKQNPDGRFEKQAQREQRDQNR